MEKIRLNTGATVVHPYNDERVISGQGTATLELLDSIPDLDAIIAPVGGGGLLSGTSIAAKGLNRNIHVIAAEPEMADDACRSIKEGRIVPSVNPKTIADGLLTSLGTLTFPIIQQNVEQIITVSEQGIIDSMKFIWDRAKIIILVETVEDVDRLQVRDPEALAYVTQTTLSLDDAAAVIAALKRRFPAIAEPKKADICYATQNRQDAVKFMAPQVDVVIVVGSVNSSNSNRLREVAERFGVPAYLVDGADNIDPAWVREHMNIYRNHFMLNPYMKDNSIHWLNLVAQSGFVLGHVEIFSVAAFLATAAGDARLAWLPHLFLFASLSLSLSVGLLPRAASRLSGAAGGHP